MTRINLNDGTPERPLSTEERQHEIIRELVEDRDRLRAQLRASEAEVARLTRELEGSCDSVPDARPLRARIAKLEATNAALVDLCEEYEAQWGDDYLAKKWGLKESLKAIKGASLSADNCVCYLWPGTCAMHPQEPGRKRIAKLEAVVAAQLYLIQVATDLRGWETTAPPSLVAEFDAAKAELEREQGGEET